MINKRVMGEMHGIYLAAWSRAFKNKSTSSADASIYAIEAVVAETVERAALVAADDSTPEGAEAAARIREEFGDDVETQTWDGWTDKEQLKLLRKIGL